MDTHLHSGSASAALGTAQASDNSEPLMQSAPTGHRLGHRALSLGAANAFDFATQFLLPVVLARCLDTADFGQYRLWWLVAGTVVAIASLAMPASLYYYLPRSDVAQKRLYVNQALIFLVFAGTVCALALSPWNPWLPEKLHGLAEHGVVLPAFLLLWLIASLLDALPTAEERVKWQAKVTVSLAVVRAVSLSLAAVLTHDLGPVLVVLLAFVALKVVLLLHYIAKFHGLRGPILRWPAFVDQLSYSAPIGAAGALYGLRTQADQWVVAALFPLGMFAAFSIAAILGPVLNLFRQSVNLVFLPSMSRCQATGDIKGMLELNSRGNIMVGAIVFPLFAFAFVFADDLVRLVYTAAYLDAAPVIRIYIFATVAYVFELSTLTMLLRQAVFVMAVNAAALIVGVALNWYLALHIGLAGAAIGSTIVVHFDRIATLWRISAIAGIPIRHLQDWKTLALLVLLAALASLLAWGIVFHYFTASQTWIRVLVGGTTLMGAYGAIVAWSGMGRVWLNAVRSQQQGSYCKA